MPWSWQEFRRRYGKPHAAEGLVHWLREHELPLPEAGFVPPPQVMPEAFQVPGDTVAAHRAYYRGEKARFARWRHSAPPDWLPPSLSLPQPRTRRQNAREAKPRS